MYHVVEFSDTQGLGIVRKDWLTPRKKETFWPPFKQTETYNKCLVSKESNPSDDWALYEIKRIFYSTG